MNSLKVLDNELVPVYETDAGEKVVYGTELHEVLEVKSNYREWVKRRLVECDTVEDADFTTVEISTVSGGVPKKQHIIKLDTAKEMAMLERNEKGKQVRRYFIKVEKKYKESNAKTPLELLELEFAAIKEVNTKVDSVQQELNEFKEDMPLLGVETDRITTAVKRRGVNALGGKASNAYNDSSIRGKVYSDIHREIKRQFGVTTYKAIKRNQCDKVISVVDEYELPYVLQEQIEGCNAQIHMEEV